jgi:peptidoglycan hydrolase CwlO-like protein
MKEGTGRNARLAKVRSPRHSRRHFDPTDASPRAVGSIHRSFIRMTFSRPLKRLTAITACACAAIGTAQIATSSADLSDQITANKSAAQTLQSEINAETSQIQKTSDGVAVAQARYSMIEARLESSIHQLQGVQMRLMAARDKVVTLENRLTVASNALAANLRTEYENGSPNLVDVILNANGFSTLLDQVSFMKRVQQQDAQIVTFTKTARARVMSEAVKLGTYEERDRTLTDNILSQRSQAAAIQSALLKEQIVEENQRTGKKDKLAHVQAETQTLQAKYNAIEAAYAAQAKESAARVETQVNVQAGGIAINTSGMATPPAGAPKAVDEMIAAGNAIATLPYIWGGGHSSFQAAGYDCSGSVSYVLGAAGLLSAPEVSGDFESYGDPGPGKWVTIYANAGHVWMEIAGWRFDTVALAEDGTRWSRGGGEFSGFVVRHPAGL